MTAARYMRAGSYGLASLEHLQEIRFLVKEEKNDVVVRSACAPLCAPRHANAQMPVSALRV